jgi:hypothetical protein
MGRDDLDYIGQTGMGTMTLGKRLGMLRGVYGERMPYCDPHTAGPPLWALWHQTGEDFEVSVVPVGINAMAQGSGGTRHCPLSSRARPLTYIRIRANAGRLSRLILPFPAPAGNRAHPPPASLI